MLHKKLISTTPNEQAGEVVKFLSKNRLNPSYFLYRVFNSDRTSIVLEHGTDRKDTSDLEKEDNYCETDWDKSSGKDKLLKELALTREDGLWCGHLDVLPDILDPESIWPVPVKGKIGIAVYKKSDLIDLGGRFYAFRNPKYKLDALVAVISN